MELLKSIFSGVLTMSLKAIPVILLVLLLRFALRRAPKRWAYALWAVPLYRLVCPAALPAAFSLYNLSFLPRSTRSGGATGTAADFLICKVPRRQFLPRRAPSPVCRRPRRPVLLLLRPMQ